jgi:hypothetical protein
MIMKRRVFISVATVAAAVAASSLPAANAADATARPVHGGHVSRATEVSAIQRSMFKALRKPASTTVPLFVAEFGKTSKRAAHYGINVKLTRRVTSPDRTGWYVIPGTAGLCLAFDSLSRLTCVSTAQAAAGRLLLATSEPDRPDHLTYSGLAPDGVTGAIGELPEAQGLVFAFLTSSGAYQLDNFGPLVSITLDRSSLTVSLGG